jgi:methyl-accepting chemotaxis protein
MSYLHAVITDPYYDPASDSVMASCSAPIFAEDGSFIGCITVDISLDTITELVGSIRVGEGGRAVMLASDGTYIYTQDETKVQQGENISSETGGIGAIGNLLLSSEAGEAEYVDGGETFDAFFGAVPEVAWRLLIVIPQSEIYAPVMRMTMISAMICVVAIIICVILIFMLATSVAKAIMGVNSFAKQLAQGDFTVNELGSSRKDEIGEMSRALDEMYRSNSSIIGNISSESGNVNDASSTLSAMSEQLSAEFTKIKENMDVFSDRRERLYLPKIPIS